MCLTINFEWKICTISGCMELISYHVNFVSHLLVCPSNMTIEVTVIGTVLVL